MTAQAGLWTGAGLAFFVAILAAFADRARSRRHDLDTPGWVPWTAVQVAAIFAAIVLAVFAFRS